MANSKHTDASKTETALAKPLDVKYMALVNPTAFATLKETISETLGGEMSPFQLDSLTTPAGGGTVWEVPGLEGPRNMEKVQGVLIYVQAVRAYYKDAFGADGGNQPPDCNSPDNQTGYGTPGGQCASCPFSQFGSATDANGAPTKGQACKERRQVLFLVDDDLLPKMLNVPPSGLQNLTQYCLRLGGKALPWFGVVTELGLEKAKSSAGITYSKVTFRMVGLLPPEQAVVAREYKDTFGQLMRSTMVTEAQAAVAAEPPPAE